MSVNERLSAAQDYANKNSTCCKVQVGSVIVSNKGVVFGCNHGMSDCKNNGCRRIKLYGNASKEHRLPSDCDAVHSEVDAIGRAAKLGFKTEGATIYVTRYPCEACARAIVSAGISEVIYGREQSISSYTSAIFKAGGVKVLGSNWTWEDTNE